MAPVAEKRITGSFRIFLALFILLTGDMATIVQGLVFGIDGGAQAEFAAAMLASMVRDLLLLAPVFMLSRHPLGLLHPLLLAVVIWPIVISIPSTVEQLGGWGPVLAGGAVANPYFDGLGWRPAPTMWTAIAKYNALEIIALGSTYIGFAVWKGHPKGSDGRSAFNPGAVRAVMLVLIVASTLALVGFLYWRGGISEHLQDLGQGRFKALAGMGIAIVAADLSAVAMLVWLAVRPKDSKSLLFLFCLATVVVGQFLSNGSRSATLSAVLMLGLVWSLRRQQVPWRIGLILAPLLLVSVGALNAVRTSSWTGQSASEAATSLTAAEAFERMQQDVQERRAVSAQVPVVEKGFAVAGGPLLGESYLAAIFAAVPRAIWEEKPRGPGSLYARLFLRAGWTGMAVPVSATAEAYWNFGPIGVIFLGLIYGMLIRAVYLLYRRRFPDPFIIGFYALFVTTFQFSTDALVTFQQQLMLLGIAFVAVKLFVGSPRKVRTRAASAQHPVATSFPLGPSPTSYEPARG